MSSMNKHVAGDAGADIRENDAGVGNESATTQEGSNRFPSHIPFMHDLGVEFVRMENGEAELALPLQERHTNSWFGTHGGVVMSLLDVAMSLAARSLEPLAHGGVTIEMKTTFMQPAGRPGDRIRALGKVSYQSRSLVFCEGEVWDGDKLAARAMGTFKLVKRLDAAKKL